MFRRNLSRRPGALIEALERRSLFDATVADSPVEDAADVEASMTYPSPPTPPTVSIASRADGSEDPADIAQPQTGPVPVEFVVSRSGGSTTGALDVTYRFVSGTAVAGDFVNPTGYATIPAGESSGVLKIHPIDDAVLEPTETFFIELAPPQYPGAYAFADPAAPPRRPAITRTTTTRSRPRSSGSRRRRSSGTTAPARTPSRSGGTSAGGPTAGPTGTQRTPARRVSRSATCAAGRTTRRSSQSTSSSRWTGSSTAST